MATVYLLYYDFKHTSDNHTGMTYLAKRLSADNPNMRLIKHIRQGYSGARYVGLVYAMGIALYLLFKLRRGDKVFFMEYLTGHFARQDTIARLLRKFGRQNFMLGLVHLPEAFLRELYGGDNQVARKLQPLDKIMVFGSRLKQYFNRISSIPVGFIHHYADRDYYVPNPNFGKQGLHVLAIGGIKRNLSLLNEIAKQCTDVTFHICAGSQSESPDLLQGKHVRIYGKLLETDLLRLMQSCDVNLSVLEDTVGSNAITSAMAVGLVQVVSHVGSIEDYCSPADSFLCVHLADYIHALRSLAADHTLLAKKKAETLRKAEQFDLKVFVSVVYDMLETI